MGITKRILEETESATQHGVEALATIWPTIEWKVWHPDTAIVQVSHDMALCTECWSLMRTEISDWQPDYQCETCYNAKYNSTCARCEAGMYDPAVETGDMEDADPLCASCWGELMDSD